MTSMKSYDDLTQEEAKSFYEWRIQNRWFTKSRGKWNYTFEQGTRASNECYEKHYRKTTEELLELFFNQIK